MHLEGSGLRDGRAGSFEFRTATFLLSDKRDLNSKNGARRVA